MAEISELIHTASMFHHYVIDDVVNLRIYPAVHVTLGNKVSILAGDYLLARASIFLAILRNVDVVDIMRGVINHLVRGGIMQMRVVEGAANGGDATC